MASPCDIDTPENVTELSCWKRVSACGTTSLVIVATVEAGITAPDGVRM